MTSSTYIRLAGPLQSWAGLAVSGNFVRTEPRPTASALRGLLAAALGARRGQWPTWLEDVYFTVREDKPPTYTDDFQTIGSREDEFSFRRRLAMMQQMKATSIKQLSFNPAVGATAISRRTYLADAEFIVRITHNGYTESIDSALRSPEFALYLGRKAFPAVFPFYLGTGSSDILPLIPAVVAPGSTQAKTSVRVFDLALGEAAVPSTQWVPAVATRNEWLRKVDNLALHRRATA